MSGPEFFQTRMGQQFYDGTMRRIADALERLADSVLLAGALGKPILPQPEVLGELIETLHAHLTAWEAEAHGADNQQLHDREHLVAHTRELLDRLAAAGVTRRRWPPRAAGGSDVR